MHAAKKLNEVMRVLGTLRTMWKEFHHSPKKAEMLIQIQAVLNSQCLKSTNPVTQGGLHESDVYVLCNERFELWLKDFRRYMMTVVMLKCLALPCICAHINLLLVCT